jgi:hypothetical protein
MEKPRESALASATHHARLIRVAWDQAFFDPIILQGRTPPSHSIAVSHCGSSRSASGNAMMYCAASRSVMLVGEHGGDPMVPRIAMMQALQRAFAARRKRAKVYNVIR